ncbi:hypothetical protein CMEL01_14343 [Colletotrichum melonis]|uniref:Uncharacterized protein n=1 Tax=Colletotrichum melonis TaxID=1209925 RepID=A0AAI9UUL5_9PEZI|nr:hypothetical protein CMEL01_14343 [Colletotrichum melonis]
MASHHTGREWTEMKSVTASTVLDLSISFVSLTLRQMRPRTTPFSESTGTFLRHINVLDKPADPSAATVTDFTAQGLGPAFRPSADGNSVTSEKGALCILSGAQHEPLDEMTSRTYPVPFVAKSTLVEKGSISDVPQVESHVVAQAFDDDPTTFFTH